MSKTFGLKCDEDRHIARKSHSTYITFINQNTTFAIRLTSLTAQQLVLLAMAYPTNEGKVLYPVD